jgi:RES domain-containing protein
MIVYRIGKTKYSNDLTGEGARINGGRWNHILTPCVYTSENRALALLEYTVNVNIDDIPRALSITAIEIPDDGIEEVKQSDLPGDWKLVPAPASTKDFGTNLLKAAARPILKIPSTIILKECNFLLNPFHVDSRNFKIVSIEDFAYDVRIKLV